jgi:hypothetical protein
MAAAAPLYARPRSSERAPHQSKLEPTSCSTRFVVALRPFHTPPASTGCWRHPSALTSSARGIGLAGRGLQRPVTLETALPLWAAGTYDSLPASRYAFLNPLCSRVTQMEKAWRPDNDLVRAVDNHRWTTGTQSASRHGMCSPAGICVPERRYDQRFRWSSCWWSPPPESNRRPHPYLPWNHREPLCGPPFSQVTPDRKGRSYRFSFGEVMRSQICGLLSSGQADHNSRLQKRSQPVHHEGCRRSHLSLRRWDGPWPLRTSSGGRWPARGRIGTGHPLSGAPVPELFTVRRVGDLLEVRAVRSDREEVLLVARAPQVHGEDDPLAVG